MPRKKTNPHPHLISKINVLGNIKNPHQGGYYKALFLCSAGLMRSATAAHIFSAAPYNWNTRTAGTTIAYTMTPVTTGMIEWADDVFCMEDEQVRDLTILFGEGYMEYHENNIRILNIPDRYGYRHPDLITLLHETVPTMVPYAPRDK